MANLWYVQAIQKGVAITCGDEAKGLKGLTLGDGLETFTKNVLGTVSGSTDMSKNYVQCGDLTYPEVPEARYLSVQITKGDKYIEIRQKLTHALKASPLNLIVVEAQDTKPDWASPNAGGLYISRVKLFANCYREGGGLVVAAAGEDVTLPGNDPTWYVFSGNSGGGGNDPAQGVSKTAFDAFMNEWNVAMKK